MSNPLKNEEAARKLVAQQEYLQKQKMLKVFREKTKDDFHQFIRTSFKTVDPGHKFHDNWHIEAIAEYLEACRKKQVKRLIINMPPRSLKSICTAVSWPAYIMGHNPAAQIMCGSYSQRLAQKHSLDTQLIIGSRWYKSCFPDVKIDPRQADKTKFITTSRGHRIAVSTGSTATGEGGDYIVIDDPTNPIQAASDVERQNANEWFSQTITSRLNDPKDGVIVVVMQRLHEMDLSGFLLDKGGWEHLNLQAVAERRTIVSVGNYNHIIEKGDYLDEVRLSEDVLEQKRRDMTAYGYAGQYQQNPAPDEGGILKKKHWRRWPKDTPPDCFYIIQVMDTAFEDNEDADESVITTWGLFNCVGLDGEERVGCIILDCEHGQWEYSELKKVALQQYRMHQPDKIIIEKKASGMSLIQDLRRMRLPVTPFKVAKDKVFRAHMASPVLEKGHVWYMKRDWSDEVIKQCATFPNATYDDIVDTCTTSWLYLRKRFWLQMDDDDAASDKMEYNRNENTKPRRLYGGQAKQGH